MQSPMGRMPKVTKAKPYAGKETPEEEKAERRAGKRSNRRFPPRSSGRRASR